MPTPMTITEKILARAAGRKQVVPGEVVTARVDLAMANDTTAPLAVKQLERAGCERVFDPAKIAIFAGRNVPFNTPVFAAQVRDLGLYCERQGIEHFYGYGEGMDHALAPELGMIRPGMLICNADSHTCTYGALGALGVPMGSTDIAYVFAFGETWLRVPETLRVVFRGKTGAGVTSKDLGLAVLGRTGVDGARYKAMEFTGDALDRLTVDERFTISNLAIEMGAKTALMAPDATVRSYLEARGVKWVEPLVGDPDARVERTIEIDLDGMPPMIARPHLPSDVVPIDQVRGVRVTQVNIGTCTNGRIVDLRQAVSVLRGRKVAKGVRLIVTPATNLIYRAALKEGLIDTLMEAGANVHSPGCGACSGRHQGVLGATDVCVATHNRNFRGRMGHKDAQIYLSSPYVAAATALAGEIVDPRGYIQ